MYNKDNIKYDCFGPVKKVEDLLQMWDKWKTMNILYYHKSIYKVYQEEACSFVIDAVDVIQ